MTQHFYARFIELANAAAHKATKRKRGQLCRKGVGKKFDRIIAEYFLGLRAVYSNEVVFIEHPRWGCVITGVK